MARLADPLDGLDHDHASLGDALDALMEARRSGAEGVTLVEHAERLRDEFLDHFGDEEEHLFPELAKVVPSAAGDLDELQRAHDTLCGLAVRIAAISDNPSASASQLDALIARLDAAYRQHAKREVEVLRATLSQVSPERRATLFHRLSTHPERKD